MCRDATSQPLGTSALVPTPRIAGAPGGGGPPEPPGPAETRPALKTGIRHAWRSPGVLQFGLDPERAVVLEGVDVLLAGLLAELDGSLTRSAIPLLAVERGVEPDRVLAALDALTLAGLVEDRSSVRTPSGDGLVPSESARIAPDLRAQALAGPRSTTAPLDTRRGTIVAISGAGRVGSGTAALLAAAGIGTLVVDDEEPTLASDLTPFGLGSSDLGRPRAKGVQRAVSTFAPSTRLLTRVAGRPDLVVLAPAEEADRATAIRLTGEGIPYLVATVREGVGVLGPLVVPGVTACLHCLDLHRADLDPAWPNVLAQTQSDHPEPASDVALAGMVASLAALHVTTWLQGGNPTSMNAALSVYLPEGRVRRRSFPPHPDCGCRFEHLGGGAGAPAQDE